MIWCGWQFVRSRGQRSPGLIVALLAALRASPDCARLDEFQQAGLSAGRKEPSHARVYLAPCADANSGPHGGTRGLQPDAPHRRAAMTVRARSYLRGQPHVQWCSRARLFGSDLECKASESKICNGARQIRQFGAQTVNAKPKS